MASLWTATNTAISNAINNTTFANTSGAIALGSHGTSANSYNTYKKKKKKTTYYILGEYVEVKGWQDPYVTMAISTLNILKKPYYEELKKNNFRFPTEIEDYLKIAFRDDLIDEIFKPIF